MLKTFKEYLGGIRLGYDNVKPMLTLGDKAPKVWQVEIVVV